MIRLSPIRSDVVRRNLLQLRKLVNYLGLTICYRLGLVHVPFSPSQIDIEPTNTCNLTCEHCQVTHWNRPRTHLSKDQFIQITAQFPRLVKVKLQGMGEPFLNKQLVDMLESGERAGLVMHVFTNGTCMTDAVRARLRTLRHTHIQFSLDGARRDTFESIRPGSNFKKVLTNIRTLVSGSRKKDRYSTWTLILKSNVGELQDITRLASTLGVQTVHFQSTLSSWGKDELEEVNRPKRVSRWSTEYESARSRATTEGRELGLNLKFHEDLPFSQGHHCVFPWKTCYVDASGNVVPCCVLADAQTMSMGNLFEESFASIWNGPRYKEFRRKHVSGDVPEVCRGCYAASASGPSSEQQPPEPVAEVSTQHR